MRAKLKDAYNFSSKLTLKRSVNIIKNIGSYLLSRGNKSTFHSGMPVSIAIEPTTSCNLRCPECPSGLRSFTRPTGMLAPDLFKKILDELSPTLSYLIFYFQGEPYLHGQFFDLIKYAHQKNIYTATSTNAHYLHEENARRTVASGLDRLIISIDGTSQETYASYRIGGKLSKVIEGTKQIVAAKRAMNSDTPYVIFQFLVVRPNEHQIAEVQKLASDLGVDEVKLKTAQIYDFQNGNDLIPTVDKYARYKQQPDGTFAIKSKLLDHCWKMWHSCVITWDGRVVPCCFDKDAHYVMGDLQKQSFQQIWNSGEYRNFRGSLLRSRSTIQMCQNCTEGTKIWA